MSRPRSAAFGSWNDMLGVSVPQDRALSSQPGSGRTPWEEIRLDIPREACAPLEAEVRSRAAAALVGDAESHDPA